VRVQTAQVAKRDSTGQVFWLPRSRLLFTCAYGCAPARVLDGSLVTRSRFRWTAGASALSGARLYGVDHTMSLFRAALPSGPQRTVRRLPGRPTVVASATS
jgi:hypothetical protein